MTAPSRTRIRHIVLVNWRGARFSVFELDRHITALEGANGVGKTQVMAAAFVTLLPIMRFIQFTAVGESAAKGHGLHGRLGDPRSPSFSALDCDVPGHGRVIAGVQLDAGSSDHVDLKPFIITHLAPTIRLADVFLHRTEHRESFTDRAGIRAQVKALGGEFHSPDTTNAYCKQLFDYGIVPLPINEASPVAQRWADLLRTSMYGGLSAAVTTGIKEFLLKREDELSRTLETIRENLRSCRLTQEQVKTSRALRNELGQVCDHGEQLLATALAGARAAARDAQEGVNRAVKAADELLAKRDALRADFEAAKKRLEEAGKDENRADDARRSAETYAGHVARAHDWENQIAEQRPLVAAALGALEAAKAARQAADQALARAREEEGRRRTEYTNALHGLNEQQQGLAELAARNARHLHALKLLAGLAAEQPDKALTAERIPELQQHLRVEQDETARRYAELKARVSGATAARMAFLDACGDLAGVMEVDVVTIDHATAYVTAAEALQRVERSRTVAADAAGLGEVRGQTARNVEHQTSARRRATDLGLAEPFSAQQADTAAKAVTSSLEETSGRHRALSGEVDAVRGQIGQWENLERDAKASFLAWSQARALAHRVGEAIGLAVTTADMAMEAVNRCHRQYDAAKSHERNIEGRITTLEEEQERLGSSGTVPPSLRALRDAVEGAFLSQVHDGVALAEAANVEARLGPWRDALLVDDVTTAAEVAAQLADAPAVVYLLPQQASVDPPAGTPIGDTHVLVPDDGGYRLTRLPSNPIVGSRARAARLEQVRTELALAQDELGRAQTASGAANAVRSLALELLPQSSLLEKPDPHIEATELRGQITVASKRLNAMAASMASLTSSLTSLRARDSGFRDLLPLAAYLDMADQATLLRSIDDRIAQGKQADLWLKRVHAAAQRLETSIQTLRQVPPDEADIARLKADADTAHDDLKRLEDRLRRVDELEADRIALTWTDAPRQYREREHLLVQLKALVAQTETAFKAAEGHTSDLRGAAETAQTQFQEADTAHSTKCGHLENCQRMRAQVPVEDASQAAVEAATSAVTIAETTYNQARRESSAASHHHGDVDRNLQTTTNQATEAQAAADQAIAAAKPLLSAWEAIASDTVALRFLPLLTQTRFADLGSQSAEALNSQKRTLAGNLVKAIGRMVPKGVSAEADVDAVRPVCDAIATIAPSSSVEMVLAGWMQVHRWMQHRLPTQIAASDDLFIALVELDTLLEDLQARHAQYEDRLKSSAADVAQKIKTACRKASRRIEKLNGQMAGVSFGSIARIAVHCETSADGTRRLGLLSQDQGQMRWDPSQSFSEAIQHLLGEQGGNPDRYLDYRNYLTVRLNIERRDGPASGASTGESIGIGALLMMATMSLWEDENRHLARAAGRRPLRFLLLDEANRLDQKNQTTVMELCHKMDLQLLIAAPDVSSMVDNITYRLAQIEQADGSTVMHVVRHGRRLTAATG